MYYIATEIVGMTKLSKSRINEKCSSYGVDSKQYCLFRFHWRQIKGLRFMIKIATVRTITKGLLDDNPQRQRPKSRSSFLVHILYRRSPLFRNHLRS
jgi:hypothetical protein